MRKIKPFIQLLLISGLIFAVVTACDKTDDLDGDSQSEVTLKDLDGNVYKTVKIGNQTWLAENLRTTKYNDGTQIPYVTDDTEWWSLTTGAYRNPDNNESYVSTYGRLYNWYAVNTGKLAPTGWHLPTTNDYTILENYLIANGFNYDESIEKNKYAKSLASTTGWHLSTVAGTPGAYPEGNNSTGFEAFPNPRLGSRSEWWTNVSGSGEYSHLAFTRVISYDYYEGMFQSGANKYEGCPVRLIMD